MGSRRSERINSLLREQISELLQRQAKDPRLHTFITVTGVSTSPDLRWAKVFVSILGSESQKKEVVRVLSGASGFLQRELSRRLTLRRVPELVFHYDDSIEHGAKVLKLIAEVSSHKGDV